MELWSYRYCNNVLTSEIYMCEMYMLEMYMLEMYMCEMYMDVFASSRLK